MSSYDRNAVTINQFWTIIITDPSGVSFYRTEKKKQFFRAKYFSTTAKIVTRSDCQKFADLRSAISQSFSYERTLGLRHPRARSSLNISLAAFSRWRIQSTWKRPECKKVNSMAFLVSIARRSRSTVIKVLEERSDKRTIGTEFSRTAHSLRDCTPRSRQQKKPRGTSSFYFR